MSKQRKAKGSQRHKRERGGRRPPAPTILVVCEDKKSSSNYFKALLRERHLTSVQVDGAGGEPKHVVERAIELNKPNSSSPRTWAPFDMVWCVFDVEAPQPHDRLNDALQQAKDRKIEVALSNPCFEYWLLLHFKRHGSMLQSNKQAREALREQMPDYDKGKKDFDEVVKRLDEAMNNAVSLNKSQWKNAKPTECNPCTDIHKLVQVLLKTGKRPYQ